MWEMMALERGKPYDLHGIQVGIGTVLSMKLYRKIREIKPDRTKAEAWMKAYDREAWEAQVKRIFGKTAGEILTIEEKTHKNSPERHAKRLDNIIAHWDEIVKAMDEELPDYDTLYNILAATGMPLTPEDIDISLDKTVEAFIGSRDIRDKYVAPPHTTDFGIMFLPIEGLYAEVVRRGMIETLQNEYHINIAGPTTMAALLNSLQMGFKTLAIQKRSGEVWKLLGAVKTEFDKFGGVVQAAQLKLEQAGNELDKLVGVRTRQIQRKLANVTSLSDGEATAMLEEGFTDGAE
jgi:hypothetical protein